MSPPPWSALAQQEVVDVVAGDPGARSASPTDCLARSKAVDVEQRALARPCRSRYGRGDDDGVTHVVRLRVLIGSAGSSSPTGPRMLTPASICSPNRRPGRRTARALTVGSSRQRGSHRMRTTYVGYGNPLFEPTKERTHGPSSHARAAHPPAQRPHARRRRAASWSSPATCSSQGDRIVEVSPTVGARRRRRDRPRRRHPAARA